MTFLLTYTLTEDKIAHKIIHKATLCSSTEVIQMSEKPYLGFLGLPLSPVVPVALRCKIHISADTHHLFAVIAKKKR